MMYSELLPASMKNASSDRTADMTDKPNNPCTEDANLIFRFPLNSRAEVGEAVV